MIHHSEFSGLHQNSFMKRIFDLQELFGFTRKSQLVKKCTFARFDLKYLTFNKIRKKLFL